MTTKQIADRIRAVSERRRLIYYEQSLDMLADTLQDLWDDVDRHQGTISLLLMSESDEPIGVADKLDAAKIESDLGLPRVGDK